MTVAVQQHFQLQVGQAALFPPASLTMRFAAVSADSRCAKGERCFWEGDAVVQVQLQRASGEPLLAQIHTSSRSNEGADIAGYHLRLLRLDPPRTAARQLTQPDYRATFELTRGGAERRAPTGTGTR